MQCTVHICILLQLLLRSRHQVLISKEGVEIPSHSGSWRRRTTNSHKIGATFKQAGLTHQITRSASQQRHHKLQQNLLVEALTLFFSKMHCAHVCLDYTKNITLWGCGILIDCFHDIFVLAFRKSLIKRLHTSWFNNKVIENIFPAVISKYWFLVKLRKHRKIWILRKDWQSRAMSFKAAMILLLSI